MSGELLMIYICNFHVLSNLLLIFICKLHWKENPLVKPFSQNMKKNAKSVNAFRSDYCCVMCGSFADTYIPKDTSSANDPLLLPSLSGLRLPVGSTKAASETLPGFLWIGSSQCAKASGLNLHMKIALF
jgi:hypothetical protein